MKAKFGTSVTMQSLYTTCSVRACVHSPPLQTPHTDRRFHSESTLQDIRIVEISTILMSR